jgi:acyl-coenzyme A synthetase/AMP-(fatty) acid ligase
VHTYGSTEAGRLAEGALRDAGGSGPMVPVGRMRAGLEFAILDQEDRPVTDGETGELILRSRSVAVGEWRDGRLLAGRMQPDPAAPGTRIVRTGDLVRLGAGGVLHVAGRADRQLKINGVRVEPAEIEAVIRADAGVHDAVVLLTAAGVLHAFVAAPAADAEALRRALQARIRGALPPPLRPRHLSILASLPTLPAGKVDMVALRRQAERPDDRSAR